MNIFKSELANKCFDDLLHQSPCLDIDEFTQRCKTWEIASNIEIEMMKIDLEIKKRKEEQDRRIQTQKAIMGLK
jgi:hypothetical protein